MKHFYKHPQFKRWGMYSVLLAALGFSVSMNPQHFNNIARYEKAVFSADFAQTTPGKIVFEEKVIEGYTAKNGLKYNVKYSDMGTTRRAQFVLQTETEAQGADCGVCGKPFDLASDLKLEDKAAITAELDSQFARISEGSTDQDTAQEEQREKKESLEEWAKPCLKIKEKDLKMDCHAERLIALSTKLEDDASKGSIVLRYFQKYLKNSLRSAFSSNFYRVRSTRLGSVERDDKVSELNDKANDIYERIVAELQAENGEKTRRDLWAMYRGAFGKQAEYSLNMMKQGYQSGNMELFQVGKNALFSLQGELDSVSSVTMDQLSDVNSENSMEDLFMHTLQNPVANYLKSIYSAKDILNLQLQPIGEDYVNGPTGIADVDGSMVGIKKLEEIIASRARAVRGENSVTQTPTANIRQGLHFSTTNGQMPTVHSPMMQNQQFPQQQFQQFPQQQFQAPFQGPAAPISAGQVPTPFQRSGGR